MSTGAAGKKVVRVEIYGQDDQIKYVGRCLGLITAKEYCGLLNNRELWSKLFTVPTTPVSLISDMVDVENMRLAIAAKKKGEDDEEIFKKTLFFTEPLDLISHVVSKEEITFVGKDGSYILVTEEDE